MIASSPVRDALRLLVFAACLLVCLSPWAAGQEAGAETAEPAEEIRKLDFLKECVGELGDRGRQLCEMRYQDGLKPRVISEQVGLPGTAVRKALQRVRDQLRQCIDRKATAEGLQP